MWENACGAIASEGAGDIEWRGGGDRMHGM